MNYELLSDKELWSLFKSGDDGALSRIYACNSRKLYLYGLKFTGEQNVVEDVIQDLFSDMIRNRKRLSDTTNILFYLLKSLKRKLIRRLSKENGLFTEINQEHYRFDVTYSIEQEIISEETTNARSELLANAIKNLTSRQKEAIYLKYAREMNYREISEIMEISVEASRNLISAAVKSLKNSLDQLKGSNHLIFFALFRENF